MPEINALDTMWAGDVVYSSLAMAYMTMKGKRYKLFQARKLEAKIDKTKKEVGILGRTVKGNKSTGGKGTGKLTIYKNTGLFTELMIDFMKTGRDVYFDLQVTNNDPTSNAGPRTVILKDCNINTATIASFDVDGDWLEEELEFTFEAALLPQSFKQLDGMNA